MHVEGQPAGSPIVRLTHLINAWHLTALASKVLTPKGVRTMLALAGFVMDEPDHEVGQTGVPATSGERCERCGRKLQFMHRVNGRTLGRICAKKQGES